MMCGWGAGVGKVWGWGGGRNKWVQKGLEACGVGLSELFFQKLQWLNDG